MYKDINLNAIFYIMPYVLLFLTNPAHNPKFFFQCVIISVLVKYSGRGGTYAMYSAGLAIGEIFCKNLHPYL